jgi:hypothetical protein
MRWIENKSWGERGSEGRTWTWNWMVFELGWKMW